MNWFSCAKLILDKKKTVKFVRNAQEALVGDRIWTGGFFVFFLFPNFRSRVLLKTERVLAPCMSAAAHLDADIAAPGRPPPLRTRGPVGRRPSVNNIKYNMNDTNYNTF